MRKLSRLIAVTFFSLITLISFSQGKISADEYIAKYRKLAIESMEEFGIPASVKMAQALVESQNGSSRLAVEANNHFGIKCKSNWQGNTIKHTDDAPDECFRSYASVGDSFSDHSYFLVDGERYRFLFDLDPSDYTGWATGLSKAGYATNPNYSNMLIKAIETYKLYELDEYVLDGKPLAEIKTEISTATSSDVKPAVEEKVFNGYAGPKFLAVDYNIYKNKSRPIYRNNNVMFVIAQDGETFESISRSMKIGKSSLLSYNDLQQDPGNIKAGSIVYISSKKKKASNGYATHLVTKGETLHYVSQKYGIKMAKLAKLNYYDVNYQIKPGQRIVLR